MSRDDALVSAYERLVEALAADLLDAADDDVLASHTPAAARVAADALRQRLRRMAPPGEVSPASDPPASPSRTPQRPEKKRP